MTIYLLAMRKSLVMCTAMIVWPFETVFGVIDDELERRGVVPEDDAETKTPIRSSLDLAPLRRGYFCD